VIAEHGTFFFDYLVVATGAAYGASAITAADSDFAEGTNRLKTLMDIAVPPLSSTFCYDSLS